MKIRSLVIAVAGLATVAIIAADPAFARSKKKVKLRCVDRPYEFSWDRLLFGGPPAPNYCAPPVYVGGVYIGQDPDPFIRFQLRRDPGTGYFPY